MRGNTLLLRLLLLSLLMILSSGDLLMDELFRRIAKVFFWLFFFVRLRSSQFDFSNTPTTASTTQDIFLEEISSKGCDARGPFQLRDSPELCRGHSKKGFQCA